MASSNPFLSSGIENGASNHSRLWSQQWLELLQQANGAAQFGKQSPKVYSIFQFYLLLSLIY